MSTEALYQELILEHNRKPRNFREIPDADRTVEGRNPLCGDALKLWVKLDDDRIADVSFMGEGCAISKASASLMTARSRAKAARKPKRSSTAFTGWSRARSPRRNANRSDRSAHWAACRSSRCV